MSNPFNEPGNFQASDEYDQKHLDALIGDADGDITWNEDLLNEEIPVTRFAIPNTIPIPGLTAISSPPNVGKTFLGLWLAHQISAGRPVFRALEGEDLSFLKQEGDIKPLKVLYIQEEMGRGSVQGRMKSFKDGTSEKHFAHMILKRFKLTDPVWQGKIKKLLETHKFDVVIFDPLSSVLGVKNENDNSEVSAALDYLRDLSNEFEFGGIIIHHPAKGEDGTFGLRGAGDILGKVDVHLRLSTPDKEHRDVILLTYEKLRDVSFSSVHNFKIQRVGESFLGTTEFVYAGKEDVVDKDAGSQPKRLIYTVLYEAKQSGEYLTKKELFEYKRTGIRSTEKNNKEFDHAVKQKHIKKSWQDDKLVLTEAGEKWLLDNEPLLN